MRTILLALSCALLPLLGHSQTTDNIPYSNTIEVLPTDSHEMIVAKAAHVVPTPGQLAALQNEFIAFVHFGPNTFTRREWGTGFEDPKIFALKNLDTDQWVRTMKAAGMKMVILTVKHHDGFLLYPSRYSKHGIASSDFKDGNGDVLAELSASCQKYGLKLGFYLSPADLYHIEQPDGLYGNLSKPSRRTIPKQVEGRPFKNKTTFEFDGIDDYNEYFMSQLFELLTEYGPIHEVWFDGAHPKTKGGQTYNYTAWRKLIRTLAPQAVIFGREDIRWCGNEGGDTRETEWNIVPYMENPDKMERFYDIMAQDIGSREKLYQGKFLHYQQPEVDTSIREGWFYRDDDKQRVRSADDVYDIYERSVGGNATFILNIPPNREGKFSDTDVKVLEEVGRRIRDTYDTDLLAKAKTNVKNGKVLLDGDINTFVDVNGDIELTTAKPITFNRLMLQEAVAKRGERIERHAIDAWVGGKWVEISTATNVGYKRIHRFADVTTNRIRIRVLEQRATPSLAHVSAHYYKAHAPELSVSQDLNGLATIAPTKSGFTWNRGNEETNLPEGCEVHYTTDGSTPTAQSPLYTQPLALGNVEIKAVAILHGEAGPVLTKQLFYPKKGWVIQSASSTEERFRDKEAIDGKPDTYWLSAEETNPVLVVDLGEVHTIKGMAYTPQTRNREGMIAKARLKISQDGTNWTDAGYWEFGNLINDPTTRYHYFPQAVKARLVRIEAVETAEGSHHAAVAELDLF